MAFDIVNQGPATPPRLRAVLRLVARRPELTGKDAIALLQPSSVTAKTNAAEVTLRTAIELGLIDAPSGTNGPLTLSMPPADIEEMAAFQRTMRHVMLGVIDPERTNYLFNLFTAWYVALDDEVFRTGPIEITAMFNERIFPTSDVQTMNDTKFGTGWRPWAAFLGQGWMIPRGSSNAVLVPDSLARFVDDLPTWLEQDDRPMPFAEFVERLGASCPELDGGVLFERALLGARPASERRRQVSLSVSTALRQLHDRGHCQLSRMGDSTDVWSLFPASGHAIQAVTHIRPGLREQRDA